MNRNNRTECRAVEDLLVALAAGELEPEHDAQLRAHLDECSRCQTALTSVHHARTLATSLKLTSPALDRYPEFLRRLAASEAQSLTARDDISAPAPASQSLETARREGGPTDAGVAAILPLFGNRITVRNGFGQRFELRVTSSQGKQWLHLSARSLTRVAAIAAGVGLAAGISVVALVLIFFSFSSRERTPDAPPPARRADQLPIDRPMLPPMAEDGGLWIQTASSGGQTAAIWNDRGKLRAGWLKNPEASSSVLTVALPLIGNHPLSPPRKAECSVATDGKSFVVLREIEGAIYLWYSEGRTDESRESAAISSLPLLLSRKGAQPAIAWVEDRYIAAWVAPDLTSPVIEMLELDREGKPLQSSATVVAQTEQGNKVGLPAVAGADGRVLVSYFAEGGALWARLLVKSGGRYEASAPVEIRHGRGPHHLPIRLLTGPNGFLACWDVMTPGGAEIRLARLDSEGKLVRSATLVRARTPLTSFDLRILSAEREGQLLLLWSEVRPGGALAFTQRFSADGDALSSPREVFVADHKPSAVAFGDAEGKSLVWPDPGGFGGVPIGIRRNVEP